MTPTATGPTLVHVVTASGRRCECTGVCGRSHAAAGGRCDRGHQHGLVPDRLYAAPRDPSVPAHQACWVPVESLAAWCGPCLDRARRLAVARSPQPADMPDSLFDLPAGGAA